ncbi:AAA-domain-containing protein [Laetiporus sulphureus 93-53]|uniref:AAA-domain-containing protein n=1 Tax=Laetiporus sulphureus 93-53 TaxID=1314785 RepID=A0A165ILF5_9APHY|nr:AAA-domain-containing protein [Laetiporus sulphureus 93-53]KZT13243.1 AAA-domain-containing protein [Laetiporus sulphureus 93-53]
MPPRTRSAALAEPSLHASGSEYQESDASMEVDDEQPPEEEEEPSVEFTISRGGRKIMKKSYVESASEDDHLADDPPPSPAKQEDGADAGLADEDDEDGGGRYALRNRSRAKSGGLNGFIISDDEGETSIGGRYETRSRSKRAGSANELNGNGKSGRITRLSSSRPQNSSSRTTRSRASSRRTRQHGRTQHDEEGYVDEPSSGSVDAEGSLDEALQTSPEPELDDADAEGELDADGEGEHGPEQDGRPYALRQRAKINYAIPPPLEEMRPPPKPRSGGGRINGRNVFGKSKVPGWSATGAELSRWMGAGGDDSDSDYPTRTPRKPFGAGAMDGGGVFAGGAGGLLPSDLAAAAGTPSNLGKVGDTILADADPLGVNQNVTFDEVGGLDDHINSLKEMTLLPLLYPEVFQRFDLTPPRGVLFHGPPGTGKTLLARALAASCRSDGRSISFFMRKGADCLSKWVGEAERQLRLLFEEARNQQPSIIFFDEIDGLAPVRSSKQDQIHASIVSTLLALMDGMDGRGQVIVIGATNRPDAIDPALRRPGRFDREFYFPLPNLEARERILTIITRKWASWEGDTGGENVKGLAKLTKGYGGADLRALCTEAALNAVQRRYPQIYKSEQRLLLNPEAITVELRDFMIAITKLVPSSARSVSSAASSLPAQLIPLLHDGLDKVKDAIAKVLPVNKKRTVLEEAEWEDESTEGALERELLMQSMETLRVYRPRVVLHGPVGMGQGYVAAAVLHHLEGYNVQSLDLGTLLSDSTRTPEAAIVQLFVEAKRHQPSVIYIPSLLSWCTAVSETSRTTVRSMLDTLSPNDPVLLLAVVDGPFTSLPRDVREWFGPMRENRVELRTPNASQREQFFEGVFKEVQRPPNRFPDGVKRKKRVLEELPIAPPLQPRQPTAAELAVQEANDQRMIALLKYRLGPILQELKRKFKRFTKSVVEEYHYDFDASKEVEIVTNVEVRTNGNGIVQVTEEQHTEEIVNDQSQAVQVNGYVNQAQAQVLLPEPPLFNMDLERIHIELYRDKYLTPDDFLDDIRKIVHNADVRIQEDPDRLLRAQAMLNAAEVSINDFDPQFRIECQRMAVREHKRREEYRKSKEKEKEKLAEASGSSAQVYAPGTRRSARHNGQQPEIPITDPLKLERRLKRQRSTSGAATPSEDENADRSQKRSRVAGAGADGDPEGLDIVGRSSSLERLGAVRFAEQVEGHATPSPPPPGINGVQGQASVFNEQPLNGQPALLNLLPQVPAQSDGVVAAVDVKHNPFLSHNVPPQEILPINESQQLTPSPEPEPANAHLPTIALTPSEVMHEESQIQAEVEREPTPLPDFHLDEGLLQELKQVFAQQTGLLNVEQLEQLRATCLGCIWRHRSEWDRTPLLHELLDIAHSLLEEIMVDDLDDSSSPGP